MTTRRNHTTKLPSQIDMGDKILMQGSTGPPVQATVTKQPEKPKIYGDNWIIFTTMHPKGCFAAPSLRIPILRENA